MTAPSLTLETAEDVAAFETLLDDFERAAAATCDTNYRTREEELDSAAVLLSAKARLLRAYRERCAQTGTVDYKAAMMHEYDSANLAWSALTSIEAHIERENLASMELVRPILEAISKAKGGAPRASAIADHGYSSAEFSGAQELVHTMDWMVDTARAALDGLPVPELTDGPHGAPGASEPTPEVDGLQQKRYRHRFEQLAQAVFGDAYDLDATYAQLLPHTKTCKPRCDDDGSVRLPDLVYPCPEHGHNECNDPGQVQALADDQAYAEVAATSSRADASRTSRAAEVDVAGLRKLLERAERGAVPGDMLSMWGKGAASTWGHVAREIAGCLQGSADPRPLAPAELETRVSEAIAASRGPRVKMVPAEDFERVLDRLGALTRAVETQADTLDAMRPNPTIIAMVRGVAEDLRSALNAAKGDA